MYEIFLQLLQKNAVTAYQVSKATGIAQSTFSDWKNGRSAPKGEKMRKIADYFGVSLDFLMGQTPSKLSLEITPDYLRVLKEAQENEIDPEDLLLLIETIKKYKKGSGA